MKLMAICMSVILLVGYLTGGRLHNLSDLEIEWPWLALMITARPSVRGCNPSPA